MFLVYSIFRYWKFGIMLGMIMALMYCLLVINQKDRKLAEQEHFINEKVFYLQSLEDAVDIQNEQLEELRAVEDMWDELVKDAQEKVKVVRAEEARKVVKLLEAETGDTCTEAMDWMIDQANGELKWEK